MKALVKYAIGVGNIDIRDMNEPACGDDLVKIQIAYCGICGTDLHIEKDLFPNYPPVILGHEFSGTVVEAGKNVTKGWIGKRVTVLGATAVTCGKCRYCQSGDFIFCNNRRGMGHGVNGAFTRYVVVRPDQLYEIPDSFSLEEAALSEPFAAAVHAVTEISKVHIGDTVLVSGPGPIGLLCLKLLAAEGAKTIVVGTANDRLRLEAANRAGAWLTINAGEIDPLLAIQEATLGKGVDNAFECAGHPASVDCCLRALRPMGHHTQVGICGKDINFPIDQVFYKQLAISGSICYTARTWERMINIFAEGKLRLADLISEKLSIFEWRKAFELCAAKTALKVLLHPEN
ncbi:MAG TPA: alcohol dehydrogenase catalytic domain-containing protein [Bryobacteraceae bacterium]|nr:alcohol dehydrogenase catalytic domain-containing protein [Bryobacteraceae bacterium]